MSDIEKVKKLREATGAGFKDCNLVKETINAAKKDAPIVETKKTIEKKEVDKNKDKTVQEIDREKLEKKFSKKKGEKLN